MKADKERKLINRLLKKVYYADDNCIRTADDFIKNLTENNKLLEGEYYGFALEDEYDDYTRLILKLYAVHTETDEEYNHRIAVEISKAKKERANKKALKLAKENEEKALYEKLKVKYENNKSV